MTLKEFRAHVAASDEELADEYYKACLEAKERGVEEFLEVDTVDWDLLRWEEDLEAYVAWAELQELMLLNPAIARLFQQEKKETIH